MVSHITSFVKGIRGMQKTMKKFLRSKDARQQAYKEILVSEIYNQTEEEKKKIKKDKK